MDGVERANGDGVVCEADAEGGLRSDAELRYCAKRGFKRGNLVYDVRFVEFIAGVGECALKPGKTNLRFCARDEPAV